MQKANLGARNDRYKRRIKERQRTTNKKYFLQITAKFQRITNFM